MLAATTLSAGASEWYFHVTNDTSSRITQLQVSINKKQWGNFDIGSGIKPGKTVKLVWDKSTDDEPCDQWVRAIFADKSSSAPSSVDFCEDLDEPIVFGE